MVPTHERQIVEGPYILQGCVCNRSQETPLLFSYRPWVKETPPEVVVGRCMNWVDTGDSERRFYCPEWENPDWRLPCASSFSTQHTEYRRHWVCWHYQCMLCTDNHIIRVIYKEYIGMIHKEYICAQKNSILGKECFIGGLCFTLQWPLIVQLSEKTALTENTST